MSLAPNKISYHDLGSLQQIRSTASKDKAGALRQAAEQFESIFFSMLLSSMRKANEAFEADGMMNSQTTSFYRDMQDSQMATELSQNGALGLADLLVQQLSPAMGIKATMAEPVVHSLHNETSRALAMPKIILPAVKVSAKAQDKVPEQEPLLPFNAAINGATGPQRVQSPLAVAAETPAQSEHKQDSASWQVSSPAEFVKSILPAARQTAKTLGLDPIALVAQAALETGWGQRMFKTAQGANSFNLFGIKANNGWQGETAVVDTLEYRGGIAKKEQARFRSYASPEQSLQDYVNFIKQNPRYQDAVKSSGDTKAYFEQLQAAGYATDPAYAQKIMAVYQSPALQNAVLDSDQTKETNDAAE